MSEQARNVDSLAGLVTCQPGYGILLRAFDLVLAVAVLAVAWLLRPADLLADGWVLLVLAAAHSATNIFTGHLSVRTIQSFTAIIPLATVLALGYAASVITVLVGTLLVAAFHRVHRQRTARPGAPYPTQMILVCTGDYGAALGATYGLYRLLGGSIAWDALTATDILLLGVLMGVYVLALQITFLLRVLLVHDSTLARVTPRQMGQTMLARVVPLPLAVVIALAHDRVEQPGSFLLVIAGITGGIWLLQFALRTRLVFERRLHALASLNRIGHAITANLSLDDLFETLYDHVQTLFDFTTLTIAFYDSRRDDISFPFVMVHDQPQHCPPHTSGYSATAHIINTRQPLLLQDDVERRLSAMGIAPPDSVPACYVGVPLVVHDDVIGVVTLQHDTRPYAFSGEDVDLLATIAAQTAVAIRNARLFQETEAASTNLHALVQSSRLFTSSLNLQTVARMIVQHLRDASPAAAVSLYEWRTEQGDLDLLAHVPDDTMSATWAGRLLREQRVGLRRAITQGHALTLSLDARPLLVIPLLVQHKALGLAVLWGLRGDALPARQRSLIEGLVNQAANALQNARTYSQADASLHDRLIKLSAIEVLARNMSATLDMKSIINDVLAAAMSTMDVALGGCALAAEDDTFAVVAHQDSHGTPFSAPFTGQISSQGVIGRVLRTHRSVIVADTLADPDYISLVDGMRSELCVPIMREGRPIGVLNFEDYRVNAFNASHVQFVQTLAEHAAIAIENARLLNDGQRQIAALMALRALSLKLLAALDLAAVSAAVVEHAQTITHAEDIRLYWCSNADDTLQLAAQRGAARPNDLPIVRRVARTRQPYYAVAAEDLPSYRSFIPQPGFESLVCVPIARGEHLLGVLALVVTDTDYYTQIELQALDVLANQAAVAVDNTRLYEEVRAGRDLLQATLDSTYEGMMLLDSRSRLLRANAAAERMLGHTLEAYLGHSFVRWVHAMGRQQVHALTGYTLDQLRAYMADVRANPDQPTHRQFAQRRGDDVYYIDETGMPVLDDEGRTAGWLLVWRDITEERQLDDLRRELSSMIVHDLRSPLTSILSSLTMFKDLLAEEETDLALFDDVIDISLNSTHSMLNLVQSLLDVARLEQNRVALDCEPLILNDSVIVAMVSALSLALNADIELRSLIPGDLPPVWIDDDKIQRVLVNLLDNALRHTPVGGAIRVEAAPRPAEDMVMVCVVDTGPGIPPEARTRIFEKFTQLEQQALRGHKGTGLGLTFCKLVVEAHGGQIWIEEGPEGGAAFCFTLPVATSDLSEI
jgi:PAS domain S-box-containing protein